ncbi:hypothetical protein [Mycoplasma hafezii]|uniref:hypothetical protein n=1 Tax=Mycoplasma hafezii TaxID=525886 RepID=UPI003CFBBB48
MSNLIKNEIDIDKEAKELTDDIYEIYSKICWLFAEYKSFSFYTEKSCIYHDGEFNKNKIFINLDERFIFHALGIRKFKRYSRTDSESLKGILLRKTLQIHKDLANSEQQKNIKDIKHKIHTWKKFFDNLEKENFKNSSLHSFFTELYFMKDKSNNIIDIPTFHTKFVFVHRNNNEWFSFECVLDQDKPPIIYPYSIYNCCYIQLFLRSIKSGNENDYQDRILKQKCQKVNIQYSFKNKK